MILSCTGCGKSLKVADEHAGRRARCPSCGSLVAVPKTDVRVTEPAMQMAAATTTTQGRLPMPQPSLPPAPAPSTAMIPAPPTYAAAQSHAPNVQTAQPYQPQGYQTQGYPQQSYHPRGQYPPGGEKDPGIAAILEVLGGMFMQTFGIGHIYAGNVGVGLAFMFGYWVVCFFNIVLMFVLIGFLTYPLFWVVFMIISPIVAASSVRKY